MDLFKYKPTEIEISNERIKIQETNDLLAIGAIDESGYHYIEMKSDGLKFCKKIGQVYSCKRSILPAKQSNRSCLGTLFENSLDDIKSNCNYYFVTPWPVFNLRRNSSYNQ